jgi:hypothetical protein
MALPSVAIADDTPAVASPNKTALFAPHEVVAGYWSVEPGWHTELELGNNLTSRSLVVRTTLTTFQGTEIDLDPITVAPGEMRTFDLRQSLQLVGAGLMQTANSFGSVRFRYDSAAGASLYASVMVYRDGSPIAFHIPATGEGGGNEITGWDSIWWLPRATTDGYLIFSNSSSSHAEIRIWLAGDRGPAKETMISVGARRTRRESLRDLLQRAGISSTYGSISFGIAKSDDPVRITGVLLDETTGFAAMMRIFPKLPRTEDGPQLMIAPMVSLSSPDQALGFPPDTILESLIFLRNLGPKAVAPKLTLTWSGATPGRAVVMLPKLVLGELRSVNLSKLQRDGLVPPGLNWASLFVSFEGDAGDVIGFTAAYDSTGRYGLQSPFSYSVAPGWKGGRWRTASSIRCSQPEMLVCNPRGLT